ncbi:hypothetical protein NQ318_001854 [Aromia moschata]|uniref:C2H2-type domain-containing protein n=1 Tax=Aromia moschata TaxID=1265417 RepID=A0AAV8Z3B3_9CUCU|nr:hypothetical protein NQ318_001854 [Aromia moschata]
MKNWSDAEKNGFPQKEEKHVMTKRIIEEQTDCGLITHLELKREQNICVDTDTFVKKEDKDNWLLNKASFTTINFQTQTFNTNFEVVDIKMEEDYNGFEEDTTVENVNQQEDSVFQEIAFPVTNCNDSQSYQIGNEHVLRDNLTIHDEATGVVMYKCSICIFKTKQKPCLRRHMVNHTDPSRVLSYQCEKCHFKTPRKTNLARHMLTHQDPSELPMYPCDKCDYKAKHKYYLKKHMENHQDPSEIVTYKCNLCDYRAKRKCYLENHMLNHLDHPESMMYRCNSCEFKTKYKHSLKHHMLVHQDVCEVTLYQCEKCEYKAKRKQTLEKHMITHRDLSEVTTYKCDLCEFETKRKDALKRHVEAHQDLSKEASNWSYAEKNDEGNMLDREHDMDFHTDQSSFENETKDEVETHDCHLTLNVSNVVASKLQEINNTHEEIDSKMDEDHYKRFKDNASGCSTANVPVEKHTAIKKSISDAADALTLKNLLADHKFPTKVPVYKCEKCQFETKHKNSMKKHTFTHQEPSEAILYHCDKCDFKTKHKDSLKLHLDLHQEPSKVSMYRCRICQFETKRKVYLKKHLLTHQNPSEVILYRCDICAFKTKHKQSLTRHMERHRDPSRISMYQCSKCHFGIKHKDCLKKQVLIHYDPSETTMHHCDKCEFKTKHMDSFAKTVSSEEKPKEISACIMESREEEKVKLCMLCFTSCGSNCQVVDDDVKKMMVVLLLKDHLENRHPIICGKCVENLKTCYEFKLSCLTSNNCITLPPNNGDSAKLDLSHIKEEKCGGVHLSETNTICRLCMKIIGLRNQLSSSDNNKKLRIQLNKYLPKLVLNASQYVSVCTSCDINLEAYFDIMRNWLCTERNDEGSISTEIISNAENDSHHLTSHVKHELDVEFPVDSAIPENKFNTDLHNHHLKTNVSDVEGSKSQGFSIKHEEVDIKMGINDYERFKEDGTNVLDQSDFYQHNTENVPVYQHTIQENTSQSSLFHHKSCDFAVNQNFTDTSYGFSPKNQVEDCLSPNMMYHCEKCRFKTTRKNYLTKHMLTHQDPSEVTMYHCDKCSFQTKRKQSLMRHMELHQDPSKALTHQCEKCHFETKYKESLKKHMLIHCDPSEVTMYHCDKCSFQTKRKKSLIRHMEMHQDPSKALMDQYEIQEDTSKSSLFQYKSCDFTIKQNFTDSSYDFSLQNHVDSCLSSKVLMYHCDNCDYQTRHKHSLKHHVALHQDPSKVTMYHCEKCQFKTKRKDYLKKHMLIHQNPSECEKCHFESRYKDSLRKHMLIHCDPSKVTMYHLKDHRSPKVSMYHCEKCQFKAKFKVYLKQHMLTHQDSSKVTMYHCDKCNFQTKCKQSLTRHMENHQDSSEATFLNLYDIAIPYKARK